jgi:dCMP deaminase
MIINAGIEQVIYEGDYPDDFSLELFGMSGLSVARFVDGALVPVSPAEVPGVS